MDNLKKTLTEIVQSPNTMGYFMRHARVYQDGSMEFASITFEPYKPGLVIPESGRMHMTYEDLQFLLDGLWAMGLRPSARMGVDLHTMGNFGPEASHLSWMKQKLEEGWVYGEVKDPEAKTHPCLVPFDQLPREQQAKDFIFRAVVHACSATRPA